MSFAHFINFTNVDTLKTFIALSSRYRYYGVYFTNEEGREVFVRRSGQNGHPETPCVLSGDIDVASVDSGADPIDLLRNPAIILEKNKDSYVNLRYPIEPVNQRI